MKIKKILKIVAIGSGLYVLSDVWYQIGKGSMLGKLAKWDMSADEALDIIESNHEDMPLRKRITFKIIDISAK